MTLRVRFPAGDRLADVGFGGDGPLVPVPYDGSPVTCGGDTHRLDRETDEGFVLRRATSDIGGAWTDLYAFLETPVLAVDYVVASHFTSTYPRSPFVTGLTAQRATLDARHILRGRVYTCRRGDATEVRELDDAAVVALVRDTIGIDLTASEIIAAL